MVSFTSHHPPNLRPMFPLTLDLLQRTFKVGIVIFDRQYNILCVNKTIEEILDFDFGQNDISYNLSKFHTSEVFARIKRMTEEATQNNRSGSYVIKVYKGKHEKHIIFLVKVFLLHGHCQDIFIALLYDVTEILLDEKETIVKFPVYEGNNFLLLDVAKIDYFKAARNYTEIFYQEKKYLSPLSLGEIEKKLDAKRFVRIHKSFIVNINQIEKLRRTENKYRILMKNGHDLPLSRNKTYMFLKLFGLK